jgi:hypothetical protein
VAFIVQQAIPGIGPGEGENVNVVVKKPARGAAAPIVRTCGQFNGRRMPPRGAGQARSRHAVESDKARGNMIEAAGQRAAQLLLSPSARRGAKAWAGGGYLTDEVERSSSSSIWDFKAPHEWAWSKRPCTLDCTRVIRCGRFLPFENPSCVVTIWRSRYVSGVFNMQ